jgi:geranylgeranyl reductase family protein
MYDVIIVGAGPAGATSAYELTRAGLKVLLLEKKNLPRFKPCGGGLSLKFLASLPFDLSKTVKGRVSRLRYLYDNSDPFEAEMEAQLAMVNRSDFDFAIVSAAVAAGAELKDGLEVSGIEEQADGINVKTNKGFFKTKYLVGADGVYTKIGAWSGLVKKRKIGSALEVELAGLDHPQTALIGFGRVKEGYSWSFPKADHYSVGIGGRHGENLRQELDSWLDCLGYKGERNFKVYGHALPEAVVGARLQKGNILLVGDAAGLVNPLTGEGIRYAIQSGRIAASAIVANKVESYSRRIYEQIGGDLRFSYFIRAIFNAFPKLCYRYGVKNAAASRELSKAFCGDATFKDLFFKIGRKLADPMSYLRVNYG